MTSRGVAGRTRLVMLAAAAALLALAASALAAGRDVPPPQVAFTSSPPAKLKVRGHGTATATWEFSADRTAMFTCKLTGHGLIAPCSSPVTYGGLGRGRYRFTVYAVDVLTSLGSSRARDELRVAKRKRK